MPKIPPQFDLDTPHIRQLRRRLGSARSDVTRRVLTAELDAAITARRVEVRDRLADAILETADALLRPFGVLTSVMDAQIRLERLAGIYRHQFSESGPDGERLAADARRRGPVADLAEPFHGLFSKETVVRFADLAQKARTARERIIAKKESAA